MWLSNTGKCSSYADFFTEEIKIMQISSLKDISESFFILFFFSFVYLVALSLSHYIKSQGLVYL